MATAGALASAGIAMAVNQVISHLWARARPTTAHPADAHLYFVAPSGDPSFPSDHAAAAFAIAFAVFVLSRRVGTGFLLAAAAIAADRVVIGLHYPGDILAGALVGLGSAALVTRFLQKPLRATVALVSRVTDPLVRPVWRFVDRSLGARSHRA
jgi:undecaprenyl-diphosphatase